MPSGQLLFCSCNNRPPWQFKTVANLLEEEAEATAARAEQMRLAREKYQAGKAITVDSDDDGDNDGGSDKNARPMMLGGNGGKGKEKARSKTNDYGAPQKAILVD